MQLAVRLAATLLALTWITPVAATVLRNSTLIEGTDQRKVQPEMERVYTAGQGLVFKGCYSGVAGLHQPVADVAGRGELSTSKS